MAIFMRTGDTNALDRSSLLKVAASHRFQRAAKGVISVALLFVLCLSAGCTKSNPPIRLLDLPDRPTGSEVRSLGGDIKEVAPPAIFLDLANLAIGMQPQVEIAYPKADQVINETEFTAKIKLRGFSIYKEDETQLGPHLKVILDNQPAQDVYTLDEPIEFSALAPGSHTLRTFAVLPWGESFKNTTAYSQTTFHILAKTKENSPAPAQPLLTYNEPQGSFGAQPVLLDFYLNNAPLHLVAEESAQDDIQDWKIRCTVNGQSFLFDQWQPIYLKGLKPGQNWVRVELVDERGDLINGPFNSTVRLVNYDPNQKDTLSRLVRGELPIEKVGQIVLPDYVPPVPEAIPAEESIEIEQPIENALEDSLEQDSLEQDSLEQDSLEQDSLEPSAAQEDTDFTEPTELYSEPYPDESESITEPASQPEVDLYDRIDANDLEKMDDSLINQSVSVEEDALVEEDVPVEEDLSATEDDLDIQMDTQMERHILDSAEDREPLPVRSPSLEETPSPEDRKAVPDDLTAPASETGVDFTDKSENAIPIESLPARPAPEAGNLEPTTLPELTETTLPEVKDLSQPGFLEQLRTRWRSFQKGQIESQSKTIQPSTAPINLDPQINPEPQIEIDRDKFIEIAEPDNETEIDLEDTADDAENLEPATIEER